MNAERKRTLEAMKAVFDGRDPQADMAEIMVTLEGTVAGVLLAVMDSHEKAAGMLNEGLVEGVERAAMPRLNEYISVGFCSGYGDGDWSISTKVERLSRAEMDELINTMFHAQRCAWDMWCAAQHEETPEQNETETRTFKKT